MYVEHNGTKEYLTARLTDRFMIRNYFTIPNPVAIDTAYFEKAIDDTSYVAKMIFHNVPEAGRYYQTFMKPMMTIEAKDVYLHPGDTISLKADNPGFVAEFVDGFAQGESIGPGGIEGNGDLLGGDIDLEILDALLKRDVLYNLLCALLTIEGGLVNRCLCRFRFPG